MLNQPMLHVNQIIILEFIQITLYSPHIHIRRNIDRDEPFYVCALR